MKSETPFQKAIMKYLGSLGICVLRYSAAYGGQTTGVGDLICINRKDRIQQDGWATCIVETKFIDGKMQLNQEAVAAFLAPYTDTYCPKTVEDVEDLAEKLTGQRPKFKFNY